MKKFKVHNPSCDDTEYFLTLEEVHEYIDGELKFLNYGGSAEYFYDEFSVEESVLKYSAIVVSIFYASPILYIDAESNVQELIENAFFDSYDDAYAAAINHGLEDEDIHVVVTNVFESNL